MFQVVSLSIGVPTFNQAGYLRQTIDSLLSQSVAPHEIVVSNNFSTDETAAILSTYEGKVRLVRPSSHLPMMAHWNFLVSQLEGNWFALLSSDDVALPSYVQTLVRGIERQADAVLIRSGWQNIDRQGQPLADRYLLSVSEITYPPRTFYEQLSGPKINFAAFAAKKSAWQAVSGFPERCSLYGDWGLWLLLSPLGPFVYEHSIISQYRQSGVLPFERLLQGVNDDLYIYQTLIPDVMRRLPHENQRTLARRIRERIVSQLGGAAAHLSQSERQLLAEALAPLAEQVKAGWLLEKYVEGKYRPPQLMNRLRSLVRRQYSLLMK